VNGCSVKETCSRLSSRQQEQLAFDIGFRDLSAEGHADSQVEAMWRAAVDSGSEPKDIAAHVLSAIRKEQLYILPHPEFREAIRSHAEDLVLQRNPAPLGFQTASA